MAFPSDMLPRWLVALVLAGFLALLGLGLRAPEGPLGGGWVRASYDSLHILGGTQTESLRDSPVVIVYLDLNSFRAEQQNPALPWPRALHARLVRQLTAAGARAVVFDIVFSDPGTDAASDRALAEAIRESGRVILAGEANDDASHATSPDQAWGRLLRVLPPAELLAAEAAAWGVATHIVDKDFVVRRYLAGFTSQDQPSLTWATAQWLRSPVVSEPDAVRRANEQWLRYYGPAMVFPNVSFAQVLQPAGVPPDFFRDKIVLVGARPMVELFEGRQDEFRSPFHSWGHRKLFMPGVEVHATALLNLLRNEGLRRFTPAGEIWVLLVVALAASGLVWLRPIPATLTAVAAAGLTLGLARMAFASGVWFPWLVVGAAQLPAALFGSWLFHFWDWYATRRRLEAAKRVAEAKIREQAALIDKAHDAILVQDLGGGIVYANPSAERLYGWPFAELQGNGVAGEIFSPDAGTAHTARAVALKEGEWNGELRQQTRSGRTVVVASRWTLIRDEAGQPKALLLINSDITEQKELEAQFLRTQRLNTIGALAGGMAHDLNNALAPVLLGTQLLRRQTRDAEAQKLLGLIEMNTHRGAEMVRQVLLFARGRGGEFEQLDLAPLVKELEKIVRETFPKNIAVETFLPADLWPVRGNATQLHQVLLNLCVNARDAMPGGGRLSFVADNVALTDAEAAGLWEARAGDYVSLLVSDTGTGMPPEVQAKIFEPFFTTKAEGRGTGIGLSTVARIVKGHGGFLRVESEPGTGTAFEIFLPRAAETTTAGAERSTDIPRGRGELILVVDDERAVRELVGDGLVAHGYRVVTAANGEEAVEQFERRHSEVRLLLTDNAMPEMDGQQTIAAVRAARPDLPVILASAEVDAESTAARQATLLLRKPFSLQELLEAVARSLSAGG